MRHRFSLLVAFALCGRVLPAQIPPQEYAERRAALLRDVSDGVLVAFGAPEPEHDYETFVQASPFLYLTGVREPDAALIIVKRDGSLSGTLFVQPSDPSREVWTGARMGVERAAAWSGLAARPAAHFRRVLDSLARSRLPFYVVGSFRETPLSPDAQVLAALRGQVPALRVTDLTPGVERLRGRKSAGELALLRRAAEVTVEALREAMRALEPGMNEFELQAIVEYTFRRNGADRPGFASIIGSGPNSTTLHYNANDRFMSAGEVVVMDVGASYRGYTADVTRTLPVSGTFTPEQRAIYGIVREAQAAAERQLRPGAPASAMDDSSRAVIAAGLARLGLIESPDAVYDAGAGGCLTPTREGCLQVALYYMHGLGHGIGLDVHDPDQYYFPPNRLEPGSAFTIEPGIYVRASLPSILPDTPRNRAMLERIRPAIERYRNVGVRIEDDYVITARGAEWLSRAPREIDEIEALMATPYAGPAPRNRALVESYRDSGQ